MQSGEVLLTLAFIDPPLLGNLGLATDGRFAEGAPGAPTHCKLKVLTDFVGTKLSAIIAAPIDCPTRF